MNKTTKTSSRRRSSPPPARPAEPSANAISQRAFELFCARGSTNGHHIEDWLQAEQELRKELRG